MLLDSEPKLEELLVPLLARKPLATAEWLKENVAKLSRSYTLQAIYKELRKLQTHGVVVRVAGQYSLDLAWITELMSLSDSLRESYLHNRGELTILSNNLVKQSWNFSSLLTLDRFWGHLILELFERSGSKVMFQCIPHPWFELVQYELGQRFENAMRHAKTKIYLCLDGTTPLDMHYAKLWPKDIFEYSTARSPFSSEPSNGYLSVIGDYVLRIKLERGNSEEIHNFFTETRSIKSLNASEIIKLFNMKGRHRMYLEKNKQKALRLRNKFSRYFGIKA